MKEQQSSYRQIVKATSLFGGVQVFNILISVMRSKVVALLLGPAGMGIMSLLNSTINLIASLTNFGLGTSAIKDISEASSTGNNQKIALIITVLKRLVWITGLLGMLVILVLSPWLSQLTFGNSNYTFAFIWLSITLLITQLSTGQLVILQGLRKLKQLAKVNLLGSSFGLVISLPLYYYLHIDGIVPAIIGSALVSLGLALLFGRKERIESVKISRKATLTQGRNMLQMGFMISLSGLMAVGVSYILSIYIRHKGGVEQVGLYNAGFAIINTYVALIFNAMATDYYPRLSAVSHDNKLCRQAINQQAEIALLILAPILTIFFVFINWIIILLYTKQFLAINTMIYWAAMGMFFKAASWSIAFIFLAKGTSKLFFWNEFIANLYVLGLNILGYYFIGLTGLGISFALSYLLYLIQVYKTSSIKFNFAFDVAFMRIFIIQFGLALIGFIVGMYLFKPYNYLLGILIIFISSWFSFTELNKRINLTEYLKTLF